MSDERSVLVNCYVETREGDPPIMSFGADGRAIVRLHGYALVPLERYPEIRLAPRGPGSSIAIEAQPREDSGGGTRTLGSGDAR